MIHKTHNYQLSLCILFSLTDKSKKDYQSKFSFKRGRNRAG